ncbi:hypothetical protein [Streptacidiphilus fuscans]|uniref:Uncharacterized protein n=1 Tax=Streptacidiphilus fuscans TaxID=2789292 RepID=A0A931BFN6_9ACTN|nr:hypothetical protein [Streptacidiphilus fuscans]MBF9073268.1 hypothetical protein [Streptacidiphilus fuscans]
MGKDRDGDPEADARAWREAHLPALTPEHERDLARAGFDVKKLRRLGVRDGYGRSLAVSVLICFTDAYPQAASVQDISRAGEASRLITSHSADEFEAALRARGLHSKDPRAKTGATSSRPGKPGKPGKSRGGKPVSGGVWWCGWALLALVAVFFTSCVAAMDIGVGLVIGAVWLILGWFAVVAPLHRRVPVAREVRRLYVAATFAFVLAGVGASNAVLLGFGQQGVGSVDSQWTGTGSHGTQYLQCTVLQPDGSYDDLRSTGACPGPDGSPVTMVYLPGGEDQPFHPALGTRGSLVPLAVLWGVGTVSGCGMLTVAARRGRRALS